jgi:hypothetical protein
MVSEIGFDWLCFGFVFAASEDMKIIVMLCYNRPYAHLVLKKIGFVLHNLLVVRSAYCV